MIKKSNTVLILINIYLASTLCTIASAETRHTPSYKSNESALRDLIEENRYLTEVAAQKDKEINELRDDTSSKISVVTKTLQDSLNTILRERNALLEQQRDNYKKQAAEICTEVSMPQALPSLLQVMPGSMALL